MDRRLHAGFVTLIALLASCLSPAFASAAESISGTVTREVGGTPIEGVCVAAFDQADARNPEGIRGATATAANGTYTINLSGPGTFKVVFTTGNGACGTNATPVVTEWWNNKTTHADADPIVVGAGAAVTGKDAQLALPPPPGSISGRVVSSALVGLQGVCVAALDNLEQIVNFAQTDANGAYSIPNLPPANYKVIFATDAPCPASPNRIFTEYYSDKATFALADDVIVTSGNNNAIGDETVDRKPTAVDDAPTVGEDSGATNFAVLANDTDPDGADPIEIVAAPSDPPHGTASEVENPPGTPDQVAYTPDPNFCGQDSFTYTINGGSVGTVTVTVTCVEDTPTAVNDAATVAEDAAASTVDVLANDTDPDGGAKSVTSASNGAHGTVAVAGSAASVSYTPAAGYCGPDSFTYTVNGGSSATVNVTVTCVDDVPAAADDTATVAEDSGASAIDVLANDTDTDGGTKTVASTIAPAHGTVAISAGGASVTYTPAQNYCGADGFSYTLNGGSSASVNVTVTCVDDPPIAVNDAATVAEDAPATAVAVLANDTDVDGGPMTIASATDPAHGKTAVTATGVTYEPDADYCGPDSFVYTLNGGGSATVAMAVTCIDPDTTITKGPKRKLTITTKKVRVKFRFESSDARSSFQCKLDKGSYRSCSSPKSYKVKPGKHTFSVRATDAFGRVDGTPAKKKFKVVRR